MAERPLFFSTDELSVAVSDWRVVLPSACDAYWFMAGNGEMEILVYIYSAVVASCRTQKRHSMAHGLLKRPKLL